MSLKKMYNYIKQKLSFNYLVNLVLNYATGAPFSMFITTLRYYLSSKSLKKSMLFLFCSLTSFLLFLFLFGYALAPLLVDFPLFNTAYASKNSSDSLPPNLAEPKTPIGGESKSLFRAKAADCHHAVMDISKQLADNGCSGIIVVDPGGPNQPCVVKSVEQDCRPSVGPTISLGHFDPKTGTLSGVHFEAGDAKFWLKKK